MEQGGDLGYWVGYRIVKAYYQRAADKQQALREILELSDPKAFLAKSGWRPGRRSRRQVSAMPAADALAAALLNDLDSLTCATRRRLAKLRRRYSKTWKREHRRSCSASLVRSALPATAGSAAS